MRLRAAQPLKLKVYDVLAVTSLTPVWAIMLCADRAVSGGELGFCHTHTLTQMNTHIDIFRSIQIELRLDF